MFFVIIDGSINYLTFPDDKLEIYMKSSTVVHFVPINVISI